MRWPLHAVAFNEGQQAQRIKWYDPEPSEQMKFYASTMRYSYG